MFVILSRSGSVKNFELLRPFSKATEKTEKYYFALDQLYIELKAKSFLQQPEMFRLSNSNIVNFLTDLDTNRSMVY